MIFVTNISDQTLCMCMCMCMCGKGSLHQPTGPLTYTHSCIQVRVRGYQYGRYVSGLLDMKISDKHLQSSIESIEAKTRKYRKG